MKSVGWRPHSVGVLLYNTAGEEARHVYKKDPKGATSTKSFSSIRFPAIRKARQAMLLMRK